MCRVFFFIGTEVCYDWLKGIIMLKVSNTSSINYKKFSFELAVFNEKCQYKCHKESNGIMSPDSSLCEYMKQLQNYQFTMMNSKNNSYFSEFIDVENLAAIEAGSNNLTFCILFLAFILKSYGYQIFSRNSFFIVLCLVLIRSINKLIISNFVIEKIVKYKSMTKLNIKKLLL